MIPPYATLDTFLLAHPNFTGGRAELQLLWDTAFNAGVDVAQYAIEAQLKSTESQKTESFDQRLVLAGEREAITQLRRLIPLYRKSRPDGARK